MEPFLSEIARYFINGHLTDLADYCFIFPNKRAGIFFNHYLGIESEKVGVPLIHPATVSISDFVSEMSGCVEASRIELLFILYRCYRDIIRLSAPDDEGSEPVDFNKFQYWGDVIINDFTDVDKYMVDPAELFHNIEALREISSNYLTPEQIEIIKKYWGDDKAPKCISDFWNHVVHVSDSDNHEKRHSTASFVKLWQVMNELYSRFNDELENRGLAYQGKIYREALRRIQLTEPVEFEYEKYIFVGFNVLSTVESSIFTTLQNKCRAMFFWDYSSPAFVDNTNRATRFLSKYVKDYPQPADAGEIGRTVHRWPAIDVIGVPGVNGQTKIVADIVGKFVATENNDGTLLSTAVVLPEESLCLPLLSSLPDGITDVNVTMGYPLRSTPVASLLSAVVSLHLRARKLSFEDAYFMEDVQSVLSHPIVRAISSVTCDNINKEINQSRQYNIPRRLLLNPDYKILHPLFDIPVNANSSKEVFAAVKRLMTWLLDVVVTRYSVKENADIGDADADDTVSLSVAGAIEAGFIKHYIAAVDELQRLYRQHIEDLKVELTDATVFHLVEKLINGESVRFEGQPLKGLQIMGVLETRALDFENVIIMSMNERIYPRRHFAKSFIPPALRSGYGMSTLDHQESISAYYFYRLITRAKQVYLLYDSRSQGVNSSEPSRYINQLKYIYRPSTLVCRDAGYRLNVSNVESVKLPITDVRRRMLTRYIDPVNPSYISATSINNYINCPVQFVISYLEGYYDSDEVKEFFDEATYGSVLHQVVERLYTSLQVESKPVVIDRSVISRLNREDVIMPEIRKAINVLYLGRREDDPAPLTGDADIISQVMLLMVRNMFNRELDNYDSFTFIAGERKEKVRLRISDRLTINFSYTIDRVDMVTAPDGKRIIRIIDYKTGSDEIQTTIDAMFINSGSKSRNKAILQLFLYCNAFVQNNSWIEPDMAVQPMIYRFRDIGQNLSPKPIKIEKTEVIDFRMFNDVIMDRLDKILYPLFYGDDDGNEIELHCAVDEHSCKYCKFTSICMK